MQNGSSVAADKEAVKDLNLVSQRSGCVEGNVDDKVGFFEGNRNGHPDEEKPLVNGETTKGDKKDGAKTPDDPKPKHSWEEEGATKEQLIQHLIGPHSNPPGTKGEEAGKVTVVSGADSNMKKTESSSMGLFQRSTSLYQDDYSGNVMSVCGGICGIVGMVFAVVCLVSVVNNWEECFYDSDALIILQGDPTCIKATEISWNSEHCKGYEKIDQLSSLILVAGVSGMVMFFSGIINASVVFWRIDNKNDRNASPEQNLRLEQCSKWFLWLGIWAWVIMVIMEGFTFDIMLDIPDRCRDYMKGEYFASVISLWQATQFMTYLLVLWACVFLGYLLGGCARYCC